MRAGFIAREMGAGLRRNLTMSIAVVMVSTISLFFLGAGLLLQQQVGILKGQWYDRVQVSLFLCGQASPAEACPTGAFTSEQRDAIRAQLEASPLVQEVFYESQEQAYRNFLRMYDTSLTADVTPEVLPESFRVRLAEPDRYEQVRAAFAGAPGVEDVPDQRAVLAPLFAAFDAITALALALSGFMLVCMVLLVSTAIRLTAFSRRREVGIMRLIGASRVMIQLPFVLEAVVATVTGALLAAATLYAAVRFGVSRLSARPDFTIRLVAGEDVLRHALPVMLAVGVLIAAVASLASLRRWLQV
ncbi:permease-like cell division protein FtsX [Kineococcus gypseus]|uniref:permease-like cell division protein FtsX n=1 Tax=Kineococcus gypseus TaxID=1637102 RepID=UPI003D7CA438